MDTDRVTLLLVRKANSNQVLILWKTYIRVIIKTHPSKSFDVCHQGSGILALYVEVEFPIFEYFTNFVSRRFLAGEGFPVGFNFWSEYSLSGRQHVQLLYLYFNCSRIVGSFSKSSHF